MLKPQYKSETDSSVDPWLRDGVVKDQSPINPSHSQSVTQLIGAGAASDRRETLADCWSMVSVLTCGDEPSSNDSKLSFAEFETCSYTLKH